LDEAGADDFHIVRDCLAHVVALQGYLAHKKTPTPLGPPEDPRHRLR